MATDNAVTTENIIIKLGWLYLARGTAKVYKYENAVVRGIKLYVHPYRLENSKVKPLSLGSLDQLVRSRGS